MLNKDNLKVKHEPCYYNFDGVVAQLVRQLDAIKVKHSGPIRVSHVRTSLQEPSRLVVQNIRPAHYAN